MMLEGRDPIEGNLVALHRAIAALPGGRSGRIEGIEWFATDIGSPFFNGISPGPVSGARTAELVDEVVAACGTSAPLFWWTGPSSAPADLGETLVARGLALNARFPGMALDVRALVAPAPHADLEIAEVAGDEGWSAWAETLVRAYEAPAFLGAAWHEAARRTAFRAVPWRGYLATLRGERVAVAMSFDGGGAVGLYAIGTVPGARGRGVGARITAAPITAARERGEGVAILHATEIAMGVYRSLGFVERGSVDRYLRGAISLGAALDRTHR